MNKKIRFFHAFWLAVLIAGCVNSNKNIVNESLGIQVQEYASEIEYFKVNRSDEFLRPYNIYIKFKIDSTEFTKFIAKTNLISYKNDFVKYMCLEKVDNLFIKKIWDFNCDNFLENDIKWWHPISSANELLYASFYKENGVTKIENCYLNEWDGLILLNYNKKDKVVYILIQVFMSN